MAARVAPRPAGEQPSGWAAMNRGTYVGLPGRSGRHASGQPRRSETGLLARGDELGGTDGGLPGQGVGADTGSGAAERADAVI